MRISDWSSDVCSSDLLFVHAWRAARAGDRDGLLEIADLGAASQTSHERRLEATAQGGAFRRIALDATGASAFDRLIEGIEPHDLVYPVAAAALFSSHGIAPIRTPSCWARVCQYVFFSVFSFSLNK